MANWISYLEKMPQVGKEVIGYSPDYNDIFLVSYNGYRRGWSLVVDSAPVYSEKLKISRWYPKPFNLEVLDFYEYKENLRRYKNLPKEDRDQVFYTLTKLIYILLATPSKELSKEILAREYKRTLGGSKYPEIIDCALRAVKTGWVWE